MNPFPELKRTRTVKNRYKKIFYAIRQYPFDADPTLHTRWVSALFKEGFSEIDFRLGGIDFNMIVSRKAVKGDRAYLFGTLSANGWMVSWNQGKEPVGFEGDAERFYRDCLALYLLEKPWTENA